MLGKPLRPSGPPPIPAAPGAPGHGWRLSDEARGEIEAIERHIATAPRRICNFTLGERQ